jgi:hypothetical protein
MKPFKVLRNGSIQEQQYTLRAGSITSNESSAASPRVYVSAKDDFSDDPIQEMSSSDESYTTVSSVGFMETVEEYEKLHGKGSLVEDAQNQVVRFKIVSQEA